MKLSRKKHPQASNGLHLAVLADVEDMGTQNTIYGEKRTLRLTFLVDEKDAQGELLRVTDICTAPIQTRSYPSTPAHCSAVTLGIFALDE